MIPLLTEALGKLLSPITKVTESLKEATEAFNQYQRISLSLGQSFDSMSKKVAPSMDGLRGSIDQRLRSAFVGLEAGLQGNISGVAKLVNQQILTGSQFQKTAFVFAKLEAGLNISRDSTNKLSESLINTGQTYEISTDRLVDVIDDLKETLPIQQLAGMGSELTAAVVDLQAQFGPQFRGEINALMKIILDTSMEGFQKRIMLGIGDMPERLAAARTKEDKLALLYDAINAGANRFKMFSEGAESALYKVGIAENLLGKSSIQLTTLQNNIGKRIITKEEEFGKFYQQLSVLRSEVFVPIQEAFMKLLTPVLTLTEDFRNIGVIISENVIKAFEDFAKSFDIDFKKDIRVGLLDASIVAVQFISGFSEGMFLVIEGLYTVTNKLISLIDSLPSMGKVKEVGVGAGLGLATAAALAPFTGGLSLLGAGVGLAAGAGAGYLFGGEGAPPDLIQTPFDRLQGSLSVAFTGMATQIQKLKDDLVTGNKTDNENSEKTNDLLDNIDRKTPEPTTTSNFMVDTMTTLEAAIQRVLGIPESSTALLNQLIYETQVVSENTLMGASLTSDEVRRLTNQGIIPNEN